MSVLWRDPRRAGLFAVLGLARAAASAAVISTQVRNYHSNSVRVLAGYPVLVMLSAGRYDAFAGCTDEVGCAQVAPGDLSVKGVVSGAVDTVAYTRLEDRTDAGQLFNRNLNFTIPIREAVRIALTVNPRQPVLIAPSQEESGLIRSEDAAATGSGLLFLGSLSALAWPLAPRGRRREGGVVGLPQFRSKNQ